MPIESIVLKSWNQDLTGVFGLGMRHGYITTIHSTNKKQRSERNQAKSYQSEYKSHDQLPRSSSVIIKMFFSSIFYCVLLQSMVPMTHHFFTGHVLLFGRNLDVVCCFGTCSHVQHYTGCFSVQRLQRIESSCIFSRCCSQ